MVSNTCLTHLDSLQQGPSSELDNPMDEDPPSQYNNCQGIQVSVACIPLPLQTSNNQKRRKNAKIQPTNRVFYFHEAGSLSDLLDSAIHILTLDPRNGLHYCIGNRSGWLCPENFSVKYTVPRTSFKDVDLTWLSDFDTLITEACKMKKNPNIKVFVVQTKVCTWPHILFESSKSEETSTGAS